MFLQQNNKKKWKFYFTYLILILKNHKFRILIQLFSDVAFFNIKNADVVLFKCKIKNLLLF